MAKKTFNLKLNTGSSLAVREVNKAFNRLVNSVNLHSYDFDNERISWFIEDLLEDMMFIGNSINLSKNTAEMLLGEVGIMDFDGNYQIENTIKILKNTMSSLPKAIKEIFTSKSSKNKQSKKVTLKILQKYIKLGGKIYEIKEHELNNYSNDSDDYHKYVVRTKYGTSPYRYYIIENPIDSMKDANAVKACYALDEDENYLETRPILYKNWLKLDEYHQYQTA